MILFSVVLIVPLLIVFATFWLFHTICVKELLVCIGIQLAVAAGAAVIIYHVNLDDTEVWNARVAAKKQVSVPCSHSYSCNCHPSCSGSGKNRSCTTKCSTCYEHFNDYVWNVYTTLDEVIRIHRIDRRGVYEPPSWTKVKLHEPAVTLHSYENYVKAAPGSLFRHQGLTEKYAGVLPSYPNDVYDYFKLDRLVLVNGAMVTDAKYWNDDIAELNSELGHQKQANVIVVLAKRQPREWFYALEQSWIGGKKNDVIVVAGTNEDDEVAWVEVMAWVVNPIFKIKLRDDLLRFKRLERWDVVKAVKTNVYRHYRRKPMADFHYLTASITPSMTEWIITLIVGLSVGVGTTLFFHKNEVF